MINNLAKLLILCSITCSSLTYATYGIGDYKNSFLNYFKKNNKTSNTCLALRADLESKYLSSQKNKYNSIYKYKLKAICQHLSDNKCEVTNLGENTAFCTDVVNEACGSMFTCSNPEDYCTDQNSSCRQNGGEVCGSQVDRLGDGVFCASDYVDNCECFSPIILKTMKYYKNNPGWDCGIINNSSNNVAFQCVYKASNAIKLYWSVATNACNAGQLIAPNAPNISPGFSFQTYSSENISSCAQAIQQKVLEINQ